MSQTNSTEAAAMAMAAATAAREELFAIWLVKNQNTAKYYGGAIGGLIGLFIIIHWTSTLLDRYTSKTSSLRITARSFVRTLRRINAAQTIGGIQPGNAVLALVYLGINATLSFYDRADKSGTVIVAKRFGWMTLCNLCLAVFLGLKNTPLSPLAGRSFDSINVLHRCVGYTTIVFVILHAATYIAGLQEAGALSLLTMSNQIAGAVAAVSLLIVFVTAVGFVRRRQYEIFYATHALLVAIILIAVGLHRPEMGVKALIVTLLAASMWAVDRTLRFSRWIYYSFGNHCTLTPLPDRATRVTFHRGIRAQPGSSAFLWVPAVRALERHPFTLVSTEPVEFVVKARDGFTRSLYETACENPGVKFRAGVEGPYGNVPDAKAFDKVVLFAGGSGVTFTLALALDWVRRQTPKDESTLEFVWTVRSRATLAWFAAELAELRANPRVRVSTYVSGSNNEKLSIDECDDALDPKATKQISPPLSTRSSESAVETAHSTRPDASRSVQPTLSGRPDVTGLVQTSLESLRAQDRVLVAGCGPDALLNHVRAAATEASVANGPSVKLYLEQFSY